MRILFLTIDRSNLVTKHWGWIHDEFSKQADTDFIKLPLQGFKAGQFARKILIGEIKIGSVVWPQIQKKKYDFIITDSNFAFPDEPWDKIDIPKGMIIQDVHCLGETPKMTNPYLQMQLAEKQKFDVIFHRFRDAVFQWHPQIKDWNSKFVWWPHSVNPEVFNDWNLSKKYDVLMTGYHFSDIYPYRHKCHELLKNKPYYSEFERPQETGEKNTTRWPVAYDYSKLLNQSKICMLGGSHLNYPVLKYFEIAASCSCIFTNWFDELGDLGFEPNKNIITYKDDCSNVVELVEYYLNHNEERERIAKNAYDLVMRNHTAKIRVNKILKEIEKCLKK